MGMGIKHRTGNGNGRKWEITSVIIIISGFGIYGAAFVPDSG